MMTLLSISPITGADLLRFGSFSSSLFLCLCDLHSIDRLVPGFWMFNILYY